MVQLSNEFHTFCVQRFDRAAGKRRFHACAMTLLRRDQSEGVSDLEMARFLRTAGDPAHVASDLERLFRRVAFNVAVGNRDDHRRNHGFLLGKEGWRRSPAFDVNPNIDKAEHVLSIDDSDNRPSLATVLATAGFHGLTVDRGAAMVEDVASAVDGWADLAPKAKISGADIAVTAAAFSAHREHRDNAAPTPHQRRTSAANMPITPVPAAPKARRPRAR